MKKFWNSLRLFLWLTCLTGFLYPLFITIIAQLTMSHKASGDFLLSNGKIVGAKLIGQKFESDKYFWSRPSFNEYSLPSGGSNWGPISKNLKDKVEERRRKIVASHPANQDSIPPELLFASGSGLDPHISLKAAYFQMERVAQARGVPPERIKELIDKITINKRFGFFGEAYVNVLELNLNLD